MEGPKEGTENVLIETAPSFMESHSLTLASCLVDAANNVTVKIRVLNPSNQEVEIRQNTVLGFAEIVEPDMDVLCERESEGEREIGRASCRERV